MMVLPHTALRIPQACSAASLFVLTVLGEFHGMPFRRTERLDTAGGQAGRCYAARVH